MIERNLEYATVATWHDLLTRLEDELNARNDLHVESIYQGAPLPKWIGLPLQDAVAFQISAPFSSTIENLDA